MKEFPCLQEVEWLRDRVENLNRYPYNLAAIRDFRRLVFPSAVTFFVGENGSGKSTLLEAIAVKMGFNAEGGSKNALFHTHASHSELHETLRLTRSIRRPLDGFFLRAESFYNVASYIDKIDEEPGFGPPVIESYGGVSLHNQSHGESFLAAITHRFFGNGVYLLDEPESALSPSRQLAVLARMNQLVNDASQFIIATHSPILLAFPGAVIYQFGENGIQQIRYEETEHYYITKSFLDCPERMLRRLFEE